MTPTPIVRRLIACVAIAGFLVCSAALARARRVDTASSTAGDLEGGVAVTFTGFDEQPDGTSRLYVKLSRAVDVEPVSSGTHLEYFLVGATIPIRNNKNPLITRHFGVQVMSARLVSEGPAKEKAKTRKRTKAKAPPQPDTGRLGVRLVIETREPVKPRSRMVKNQDGTAIFIVDFARPSKPPPPEPDVIAPPPPAPKQSEVPPVD